MTLESVKFVEDPDGQPADNDYTVTVAVEVSEGDFTLDTRLYIDDSSQGALSDVISSPGTYFFNFKSNFAGAGEYTLRARASEVTRGEIETEKTITLRAPRSETQEYGDDADVPNYENAFDDRASTIITEITTDDDTQLPFGEIDFSPYDNPNISVTSGARFAVHEIIGGTTVRQKIGEDPTEVVVQGVCTERVATRVDQLRRAVLVTLLSDRTPNGIRAQVASASTEPLHDGGAADASDGDFLYEFSINLVEISP